MKKVDDEYLDTLPDLAFVPRLYISALTGQRARKILDAAVAPPIFAFFLNDPQYMPDNYKRYIENRLREEYGFEGVPMKVVFRKK